MNVKKLQGRVPTLREQQRASLARPGAYQSVDFDSLRAEFKSREFVGPATPLSLRSELQTDVQLQRESDRYWRLVDEFKRYGRLELQESGTPFMGNIFGYDQFSEVHV